MTERSEVIVGRSPRREGADDLSGSQRGIRRAEPDLSSSEVTE